MVVVVAVGLGGVRTVSWWVDVREGDGGRRAKTALVGRQWQNL